MNSLRRLPSPVTAAKFVDPPAGSASPRSSAAMQPREPARTVQVELLAIDLSTCGPCTRTSANLDEALAQAADRLRAQGVAVEVRKTVVASEEQAVLRRLPSSPTIRVDGRDLAFEVRERPCEDCGRICGCEGGIDCRVWVWQGREYAEAPVPMIVDAIVLSASSPPEATPSEEPPFRLPENLTKFFRARERPPTTDPTGCCSAPTAEPCCRPRSPSPDA